MHRRTSALLLALSLALSGLAAAAEPPAAPVEFAPVGTVKGVRQATARFAAQMVALGDPRPTADPFAIECPATGTSRWVDSHTWAYDFGRELPAGLRCRFTLRPDVRALDGTAIG